MRPLASFVCSLLVAACATPSASTAPAASTSATSSASAATTPSASAIASATPPADPSCGALGCRLYDSAADAMQSILDTKPLLIAVGEAHAQKGTEGIDSAAKRFTAELLPLLKGRTSDLLVELMMPPTGCEKKTNEVRKQQAPVTQHQAASDQNEYLAMGTAAKGMGIVPDLLRPTCKDFDVVTKAAGTGSAIGTMLEMIARLTTAQVKALLARKDHDAEKAIVVYGGAFHGDPDPPASHATWSFAADLAPAVKGRYVAVQLFVPEYIKDDDAWKSFVWYEHFDKRAHPDKVTMFHPRPDSYVIIFAAAKRATGE